MTTRRLFLTSLGAGLAALRLPVEARAPQDALAPALRAPVGLQLWSLREYLPKDLAATLRKVRELGFRDVEGAGLYGQTSGAFRAALDAAGLRCQSAHVEYETLRDKPADAFAQAQALGATTLVCPWIPHGDAFTHDDAMKAAEVFNRAGSGAAQQGMRLAYHCHGYEFVPSPEGTLFETLVGASDPAHVGLQIDVLHAFLGGGDPAALIARYGARVWSLHLKDLKKGFPRKTGLALAPENTDVPVGSGQVDMPAVLRAAVKAGVPIYYIEDESADPLGHIPLSLAYLRQLTL